MKIRHRNYLHQALFCLLLLFSALAPASEQISECRLQIGYDNDRPFHFDAPGQQIRGIDIDLLRSVLAEMDCQTALMNQPWARSLGQLKEGTLDLVMGSSLKAERRRFARFSLTYRRHPHVLITHKDSTVPDDNLLGFLNANNRLGVGLGWHYTDQIRAILDKPEFSDLQVAMPRVKQMIRMLDSRRLEGVLANPTNVILEVGKTHADKYYRMSLIDTDSLHFAFSKRTLSQDWMARFNQELKRQLQAGLFEQTCRNYSSHLDVPCQFLAP